MVIVVITILLLLRRGHSAPSLLPARTLKEWRAAFTAALPEIRELGYDEGFIRKWFYYLCYCEAAFGTRHISVAQIVYTRPDNLDIFSPAYDLGHHRDHPVSQGAPLVP